jgi:flagellar motor switch protein FliG
VPPNGRGTGKTPVPSSDEKRPFRFLEDTEADKIARVLGEERPQTIALVLSHLPPERAGNVLARLQPDMQADVIHRLVDLEETDPEILREVEAALEARLSEQVEMKRRRVAGLQAVTSILDASRGNVRVQILDNLAAHNQPLAEKLSPRPVAFDDLADLDDDVLAMVLDEAGPELAMPALVGAPEELVARVLGLLPPLEAGVLREQLDNPGPIRLRDVEEARRRIAHLARNTAYRRRTSAAVTYEPSLRAA